MTRKSISIPGYEIKCAHDFADLPHSEVNACFVSCRVLSGPRSYLFICAASRDTLKPLLRHRAFARGTRMGCRTRLKLTLHAPAPILVYPNGYCHSNGHERTTKRHKKRECTIHAEVLLHNMRGKFYPNKCFTMKFMLFKVLPFDVYKEMEYVDDFLFRVFLCLLRVCRSGNTRRVDADGAPAREASASNAPEAPSASTRAETRCRFGSFRVSREAAQQKPTPWTAK